MQNLNRSSKAVVLALTLTFSASLIASRSSDAAVGHPLDGFSTRVRPSAMTREERESFEALGPEHRVLIQNARGTPRKSELTLELLVDYRPVTVIGNLSQKGETTSVLFEILRVDREESSCGETHREALVFSVQVYPRIQLNFAMATSVHSSDNCHSFDELVSVPLETVDSCATEMSRYLQIPVTTRSTTDGMELLGFGSSFMSSGSGSPLGASLVLETRSARYFVVETCDICAEILKCEKSDRTITSLGQAHSVSCSDLPAAARKQALYSACAE